MRELLLVRLIRDVIRLNVRFPECSREFLETSEVHITVGNIEMSKEIVKLPPGNGRFFTYHFVQGTFLNEARHGCDYFLKLVKLGTKVRG